MGSFSWSWGAGRVRPVVGSEPVLVGEITTATGAGAVGEVAVAGTVVGTAIVKVVVVGSGSSSS